MLVLAMMTLAGIPSDTAAMECQINFGLMDTGVPGKPVIIPALAGLMA